MFVYNILQHLIGSLACVRYIIISGFGDGTVQNDPHNNRHLTDIISICLKPCVCICHRMSNCNRKNIPLISFNTLHNYIFSSWKKIYGFKVKCVIMTCIFSVRNYFNEIYSFIGVQIVRHQDHSHHRNLVN